MPNCRYPIDGVKGSPNKYTVDHIIAVTREGSSNDKSNLQILCKPHNSMKNRKDARKWAAKHGIELDGSSAKERKPEQASLLD